ncbi:hypothetical protein T484DRAFT_2022887, partial [Baffinella frigidus]
MSAQAGSGVSAEPPGGMDFSMFRALSAQAGAGGSAEPPNPMAIAAMFAALRQGGGLPGVAGIPGAGQNSGRKVEDATRDELVDALGKRALRDASAGALLEALAAKDDEELRGAREQISALWSRIAQAGGGAGIALVGGGAGAGGGSAENRFVVEEAAGGGVVGEAVRREEVGEDAEGEAEPCLLSMLDDEVLGRIWPCSRLLVGMRASRRLRAALASAPAHSLLARDGEEEHDEGGEAALRAAWLASLHGQVHVCAASRGGAARLLSVLAAWEGEGVGVQALRLNRCRMGGAAGGLLAGAKGCLAR